MPILEYLLAFFVGYLVMHFITGEEFDGSPLLVLCAGFGVCFLPFLIMFDHYNSTGRLRMVSIAYEAFFKHYMVMLWGIVFWFLEVIFLKLLRR